MHPGCSLDEQGPLRAARADASILRREAENRARRPDRRDALTRCATAMRPTTGRSSWLDNTNSSCDQRHFAEVATEQENLLAAWNWLVAADNLSRNKDDDFGSRFIIAYVQGWGRVSHAVSRDLQIEAQARGNREGMIFRAISARGVWFRAGSWPTLLNGHELVSRDVWDVWAKESVSLLAQGETDDDRWWEVRWLLRYGIAQGTSGARELCRGSRFGKDTAS